jgi:hypothetical protein
MSDIIDQLNAVTILACEPPRMLRLTWVYGENVTDTDVSEVEVRLDPDGDRTRLTLAHAAVVEHETWTRYGPGATGVGWDLGLVALDRHLHGQSFEPATWESTPDGKRAAIHSSAAWGAAAVAAGIPADQVTQWVDLTTEFYTAD